MQTPTKLPHTKCQVKIRPFRYGNQTAILSKKAPTLVKIRPFRYGNDLNKKNSLRIKKVKIRPFRYGNKETDGVYTEDVGVLKSDRFGMEIWFNVFTLI